MDESIEKYLSQKKDGWYFWNETWSDLIGPFEFKTIAILEFYKYCGDLNKEFVKSLQED